MPEFNHGIVRTVVIIGGGLMASVLAHRLLQRSHERPCRIIILEAGPLVLRDHCRNMQPPLSTSELDIYGFQPSWSASDFEVAGLTRALGGRALLWNAWSPAPEATELTFWPSDVANELKVKYIAEATDLFGINPSCASSDFHRNLRGNIFHLLSAGCAPYAKAPRCVEELDAPIAQDPVSRRFFSSVSLLMECLENEERSYSAGGVKRLQVICNCEVTGLRITGERVSTIVTTQGNLDIARDDIVVLALGTIESTKLALQLFPDNQSIGTNLVGHFISDVLCKFSRNDVSLADSLDFTAQLVKGHTGSQHFQLQISGAAGLIDTTERQIALRRELPGVGGHCLFSKMKEKEAWLSLIGIGELNSCTYTKSENRVQLQPNSSKGQKIEATVRPTKNDYQLWDRMDDTIDTILNRLVVGNTLCYWDGKNVLEPSWQYDLPSRDFAPGGRRLKLIVHEGGTLRMGDRPDRSVTDCYGRFHNSENLYATGSALFPTAGSHNGSLTAAALALRLADRIVAS